MMRKGGPWWNRPVQFGNIYSGKKKKKTWSYDAGEKEKAKQSKSKERKSR